MIFNDLAKRIKKAFFVFKLPYEVKPPYTHMVQIGDPILRSRSKDVPPSLIKSPDTRQIVDIMLKIMNNDKLSGISAPQIGIPLRIMAMQCPMEFLVKLFPSEEIKRQQMATMEPRVFINPELKVLDYNTNIESEMCGSVLSLQADVKRFNGVQLSGFDELGEKQVVEATGYIARIIQHEMDHLNGVLFTDLMTAKTLKCCIWKEINELNGYVELSYVPKATDNEGEQEGDSLNNLNEKLIGPAPLVSCHPDEVNFFYFKKKGERSSSR